MLTFDFKAGHTYRFLDGLGRIVVGVFNGAQIEYGDVFFKFVILSNGDPLAVGATLRYHVDLLRVGVVEL